jgi:hypothetical protein
MERKHIKRFLSKIGRTTETGCWEWNGTKNIKHKYAVFGVSHKILLRANRVSYEIFKGQIPEGLLVCHSCDNRSCVNPEHLFLGTDLDNTRDMLIKGRQGSQKLRVEHIPIIRDALNAGFKQHEIGRYFGVAQSRIAMIKNKTAWSYA